LPPPERALLSFVSHHCRTASADNAENPHDPTDVLFDVFQQENPSFAVPAFGSVAGRYNGWQGRDLMKK